MGVFPQSQPNCGLDRSKLIVASDFNYPPFEYQNNGKLIGFDISVACELIKRLGYSTLEIADITLVDQDAALLAGRVNLIISARSVLTSFDPATDNPAAVIYANDSTAMLFNTTLPGNVTTDNVLIIANEVGSTIGVITGTREASIIEEFPNLNANKEPFDTYDLAIAALPNDLVDGLLLQGSVGTYAQTTSGVVGSFFANVAVPSDQQTQGLGILVDAECCSLYASVRRGYC